jgi:hypothetical protein
MRAMRDDKSALAWNIADGVAELDSHPTHVGALVPAFNASTVARIGARLAAICRDLQRGRA